MKKTFDFEAWATRHVGSKNRAALAGELVGVSEVYMRRLLKGGATPSETIMLAAQRLDRIAELEAELRREKATRLRAATAAFRGSADGDVLAEEVMSDRRPDDVE